MHQTNSRTQDHALTLRIQATYACPIEIRNGLLEGLPGILNDRFPGARVRILTDRIVDELYGRGLLHRIQQAGIDAAAVVVEEGEASKSIETYRRVVEDLHRLGFDRRALLVNLGGGMVTDLGGFVAATYMRSVAYVNVPTTLLAQHDSAIGGKVGVDTPWAKNFVGAFHLPSGVYCDPGVLATLSERDLVAGIAEALKVAIIGEPELFRCLEEGVDELMDRNPSALREVIYRAVHCKVALLEPDPYEVDLRRPLNLGHSFGHALEVAHGYRDILHGEAVAFGLAVATHISMVRGVCHRGTAARILRVLSAYGLPPRVPRRLLLAACDHMDSIRLVRGGHMHFVLPEQIGSVRIVDEVEREEIVKAIDAISHDPLLGRCVGS